MFRIKQFRPNLKKKSYGLVRVKQWSEKSNITGMLERMRHETRIIGEDITSIHILTDEGKTVCVWFECSNPKYSWDRGFFKFMVTFKPRTMKERLNITKTEIHEHLEWLVETAEEYFDEEGMDIEVRRSEL